MNKKTIIFATGVFLQPVQITDSEGNTSWRWVATHFEDDSFLNGKTCNPIAQSETIEGLLIVDEEEE